MSDIYTVAHSLCSASDVRKAVVRLSRQQRTHLVSAASTQVSVCINSCAEAAYVLTTRITSLPTRECRTCGKYYTGKFFSVAVGYRFHDWCSAKCRSNDPDYKTKLEQANLEKNGHKNNMWGAKTREATKQAWIEKWGVDNPLRANHVKNKVKATNMKKLGVEWPGSSDICRKKMIETSIQKYGEKEKFGYSKAKETSIARYGVPYPMQNPEIQERSIRYRRKSCAFSSGKLYYYQGYENVAIQKLLEDGVDESDIIISQPQKIPVIEYFNPIKKKLCHYFPDIYIPSQNLLVEVKSTWTMRDQLQENLAKHQTAKALGYRHEIWICTAKKLLEIAQ